jgi:hypothetical protein
VSVHYFVKANNASLVANHEAVVDNVLRHFDFGGVERRLLCFLDDRDWQPYKDSIGIANRGFYAPIFRGQRPVTNAAQYMRDRLFSSSGPLFEDWIYMHGSTCATDLGLTFTLAHELQHYLQRTKQPQLWAANTLVPNLTKEAVVELGLKWANIPHEREARIVSKKVAEAIFGRAEVRAYVEARIAERLTDDDAQDWEFIQSLESSDAFDLDVETKRFFPRLKSYRHQLDDVLRELRTFDATFPDVDLESLVAGARAEVA